MLLVFFLLFTSNGVFGLVPDLSNTPNRLEELLQNPTCVSIYWNWAFTHAAAVCQPYSPSRCFCVDHGAVKDYKSAKDACTDGGGFLAHVDSRHLLEWMGVWMYQSLNDRHRAPAVNKTTRVKQNRLGKKDVTKAIAYEAYIGLENSQSSWTWVKGNESPRTATSLFWHPFKMARREHKYGTLFVSQIDSSCQYTLCETEDVVETHLGHSSANEGLDTYICEFDTTKGAPKIIDNVICSVQIMDFWYWVLDFSFYLSEPIQTVCKFYPPDKICYCLAQYNTYSGLDESALHQPTWQRSNELCRMMNGHLAALDNKHKIDWTAWNLYATNNAYIGLEKVENQWEWHTEGSNRPASDILWAQNPGDFKYAKIANGKVVMTSSGSEKDTGMFVCEYGNVVDEDALTTTTPELTTMSPDEAVLLTCEQIQAAWKERQLLAPLTGYSINHKCGEVDGICYCHNSVGYRAQYTHNWLFANDQCLAFDGALAKVESQHIAQKLTDWIVPLYGDYYIGLKKQDEKWVWTSDDSAAEDIPWVENVHKDKYGVLTAQFYESGIKTLGFGFEAVYYLCEHENYNKGPVITEEMRCEEEIKDLWLLLHPFNAPKCTTFNEICYCINSVYQPDLTVSSFEIGNSSCKAMNGKLATIDNQFLIEWLWIWLTEKHNLYDMYMFTGLRKENSVWVWDGGEAAEEIPWRDGFPKEFPAHKYANFRMEAKWMSSLKQSGFVTAPALDGYFLCQHESFNNQAKTYSGAQVTSQDYEGKRCDELNSFWEKISMERSSEKFDRAGKSKCASFGNDCFCINRIFYIDLVDTLDAGEYAASACEMVGAKLAKIESLDTVNWFHKWAGLENLNISVYVGIENKNDNWVWSIDGSTVDFANNELENGNKHGYLYVPAELFAEETIILRSNDGKFEDCDADPYLYCGSEKLTRYYRDNDVWYYMCQY